jgi:hypothetical protein
MSLILKQETANSVPTPPAGKGTVFINGSNQLTVKDSDGNSTSIPTFTATGNTSVFFNDAGALGQDASLTFDKTTDLMTVANLTVTGTINFTSASNVSLGPVGNVKITGGSNGQFLSTNGSGTLSWSTVTSGSGIEITDDTSTNATYYPALTTSTTGSISTANVSSTKLYFNPSTGSLVATDFNSLSDERFKTNLVKLENTRKVLDQISGYSFDWLDGTGSSYGVVAQEIEKVMPNAVTDGEKKTVNYAAIMAFMLEAIKDLYVEIDGIKKDISKVVK